jgi:hypothetical protein
MDRLEQSFALTAITGFIVLVTSVVWLSVI